jgi:hypothetical protein
MIQLTKVLSAWRTADFESILKKEIERMGAKELPLQQALSSSSYALDSNIKIIIINVAEAKNTLQVKAGIFYAGVIAGCHCADDPTPIDEQPEYCEVQVEINKKTADTQIVLLD